MNKKDKVDKNCIICDEKINLTKYKIIECPYCSFEACRQCVQRYILDKEIPICMNNSCDKEWTTKHMSSRFTDAFINNEWKEVKEKVLLDTQIALLPSTQNDVLKEIKRENTLKEIFEIEKKINELSNYRNELRYSLNNNNNNNNIKEVFTRPCSDSDCRGFLSTQWKCGLCEKYTCSDCHLIKGMNRNDDTHQCNPDDVASAKLLEKDTKHCPKCSMGIFKIDGCDQMWCTQCHTAFSWKSGRIENNIHNPHYYEWLQRNGNNVPRNPLDIICGRELNHNTIHDIKRLFNKKFGERNGFFLSEETTIFFNKISNFVRCLIHIKLVTLPKYRINNVDDNLQLRINYIRKKIDLDYFKKTLRIKNKKNEKYREIYGILDLLVNTNTDIVFRIMEDIKNKTNKDYESSMNILNETYEICNYVNECLVDISKIYNSKLITIKLLSDFKLEDNVYI